MKTPCREILERYLQVRSASLNRVTLKLYRCHVGSLIKFLEARYPEVHSFAQVARVPHIEEWLGELRRADPPYTDNTRRHFLFHARRFLEDIREWGWAEGLCSGLIRREDIPPCERSLSPERRLRSLAAELGTSPESLFVDPWLELLERYLRALNTTRQYKSVDGYRVALLSLIKFLHRHFPELHSPRGLRRSPHIEAWFKWLLEADPPYKESTRWCYISLVRRFLEDLQEWEWPERPPPGLIPRQERSRKWRSSRWRTYLGTTPRGGTPFDKAIERYLAIRGAVLRPATIRHYRVALCSLAELLQARYPEVDTFAAARRAPHIEQWLQMLAAVEPPYTNDTRRETIQNVCRFFEDIEEWGWPESPASELIFRDDFPPPQHHLPRPLAPEVDHRLMDALREDGDFVSLGLILKRRTGLRIGELRGLELDCVVEHPESHCSLSVPLGKLRTERVIPIDPDTTQLVKTIRTMRGDRPPTLDRETGRPLELLFASPKGELLPCHRFARKLKRVARSAGITENVHPHRLRHSYATELLRNGVSLIGVMKLLGHKTLKMTLRYVEVTNEDLGREYLSAIEQARHRYSELKDVSHAKTDEGGDPVDAIKAIFDELVARLQRMRFDDSDSARRKGLQRLVERLRRAQSDLPDLLG